MTLVFKLDGSLCKVRVLGYHFLWFPRGFILHQVALCVILVFLLWDITSAFSCRQIFVAVGAFPIWGFLKTDPPVFFWLGSTGGVVCSVASCAQMEVFQRGICFFFAVFTCVMVCECVILHPGHVLYFVRHAVGGEEVYFPILCRGGFPRDKVLVLRSTFSCWGFSDPVCCDILDDVISCAEVIVYGQHFFPAVGVRAGGQAFWESLDLWVGPSPSGFRWEVRMGCGVGFALMAVRVNH